MRAVRFHRFGDPSVLQIDEIAPPTPAPTEVLIRVYASSLNAADSGARRGFGRGIHVRSLPHVPGYDVAGEVVACGAAVTTVVPGDRVFALIGLHGGGQAEYATLHQDQLAIMPERLRWDEAAAVPLAGLTALQALRAKAQIKKGQRVLITGAGGGVGTFAVQLARYYGCHVTAVCRAAQHTVVRSLGANELIDYTQENWTYRRERWDAIFDAAGTYAFWDMQRVLAPDGVVVATRPAPVSVIAGTVRRIFSEQRYRFLITRSRGQDLALLARLIDRGHIQPVVDRVFAMDDIQAAHAYNEQQRSAGKIIVQVAAG